MIEDRLLLWRFRRGDRDALCRIYEKYKKMLLKLATALLNDTSAAEDIVHDVFVGFAQSAEKIKISGNLKSYLATCVANRARNKNKAKQNEQPVDFDQIQQIASDEHKPSQWIIYNEELRRLNSAIAQLPYEQREVVLLHLQGQMRFKTIARSQCVSINTAQSRYRYGLEKLRSLLDSEVKK